MADTLELWVDPPSPVRAGGEVRLVLHARSLSAAPLHLYLRGRQPTVDVVLMDAAGSEVSRRLDGAIVPAVIQARTLEAGDSLAIAVEWTPGREGTRPLPRGTYTARALLLTEGAPLAARDVTLRVE